VKAVFGNECSRPEVTDDGTLFGVILLDTLKAYPHRNDKDLEVVVIQCSLEEREKKRMSNKFTTQKFPPCLGHVHIRELVFVLDRFTLCRKNVGDTC
jgi:hypothetical protein